MLIEKILSLPSPIGDANHLCKISFSADAAEKKTLSIVSGLHGDQLTSLYISSCLIRVLEAIALGNTLLKEIFVQLHTSLYAPSQKFLSPRLVFAHNAS